MLLSYTLWSPELPRKKPGHPAGDVTKRGQVGRRDPRVLGSPLNTAAPAEAPELRVQSPVYTSLRCHLEGSQEKLAHRTVRNKSLF